MKLLIPFLILISAISSAKANVIFNTDSNGVLIGASGIIVNNQSYDIQFTNGSCINLFSNCDPTTFIFHDSVSAAAAAQALLDQVFIDLSSTKSFDSNPALTNGCTLGNACQVLTPYALIDTNNLKAADSFNASATFSTDQILERTLYKGYDTINNDLGPQDYTYAIWTKSTDPQIVPEPATLLLVALGWLCNIPVLMGRRRKTV
jgi:hypothetical protein